MDKTVLIYDTDPYVNEFVAKVLSCNYNEDRKLYEVVLDRTAFFPEGGGQECDTGVINSTVKVVDVKEEEQVVIHYTSDELVVGSEVSCRLNWDVRFRRMQNHTGEHLMCGIIHDRFGYDNVGFHMDDDVVTFDVDGPISKEDMRSIERAANEAIYKNVPISISYPSYEESKSLEYRSKLELTENIRIVTIEGYDVCACCAPHVGHTGDIGIIKVIDSMPHRGGMRITMITGIKAYEDYIAIEDNNHMIMQLLSSKRYDTGIFAKALMDKQQQLLGELSALKRDMVGFVTNKCLQELADKVDNKPYLIFIDSLDSNGIRKLVNDCRQQYDVMIAAFAGNDDNGYDYIIQDGVVDLKAFAKDMNTALNGRGGGSPQMIQGHLNATEIEIKKYFEK